MIKMYNSDMTVGVVGKTEERAGKEINKLSKDELMALLNEMKEEEEIEADADLNYAWLDEECKGICSLPEKNFLGQVEELGVYVSIWEQDGEYLIYNGYGDFRDIYLGGDYSFASEDEMEVFAERFQNNLKDIIWDDEDNELKRAVEEELNEIANDEKGEHCIEFVGNKCTSLIEEIGEYVGCNDEDYEKIGYYSGETIYRIKNRLYYMTDDSWTLNMEYHWYLQELGLMGYEYFGVKKPNSDDKKIEYNYRKNLIEKIVKDFVDGIMDGYGCSYESLEEQVKEIVRKEIGEFLEIENDEEYEEIKNPEFEPTVEEILAGILDDERICLFEAGLYTHNSFVETLNLDYVCGNEFSNPFEAIDARYREIYE